jgi:hypothetical protein
MSVPMPAERATNGGLARVHTEFPDLDGIERFI